MDFGTIGVWKVRARPMSAERFGFLQAAVIRKALEHRLSNGWDETVSTRRLRSAQVAHLAALALLIVVATGLFGQARSSGESRSLMAIAGSVARVATAGSCPARPDTPPAADGRATNLEPREGKRV